VPRLAQHLDNLARQRMAAAHHPTYLTDCDPFGILYATSRYDTEILPAIHRF